MAVLLDRRHFVAVLVVAAEEFGGLGVVGDGLGFRIPIDGSADEHGDEAEVAGDGGAVGGVDGGDGFLPGFDAVEEIAVVARGVEERDVAAEFGGEAAALLPGFIRSVVFAAVDVDPAIFADPLGAALDVAVAAGDGDRGAVGISLGWVWVGGSLS